MTSLGIGAAQRKSLSFPFSSCCSLVSERCLSPGLLGLFQVWLSWAPVCVRERQQEMETCTLSSLVVQECERPRWASEPSLGRGWYHLCLNIKSRPGHSALRAAAFGPEGSGTCPFRAPKEIFRDIYSPGTHPMQDTVLGAAETNLAKLLPLKELSNVGEPSGSLTAIPVTFRGQKTRSEPVGRTHKPKAAFQPTCWPVPGWRHAPDVWRASRTRPCPGSGGCDQGCPSRVSAHLRDPFPSRGEGSPVWPAVPACPALE